MRTGFVFACGMLFGGACALAGLYATNWRILQSWLRDQREPR